MCSPRQLTVCTKAVSHVPLFAKFRGISPLTDQQAAVESPTVRQNLTPSMLADSCIPGPCSPWCHAVHAVPQPAAWSGGG